MIRVFNQYVPRSFFVLVCAEALIFAGSIYAGTVFRFRNLDRWPLSFDVPLGWTASLFSVVMIMSMMAMGLYQRRLREGAAGMLVRVGAGFVAGVIAMSLLFYAMPTLFLGRGAFGYSLVIAFSLICAIRLIFFGIVSKEILRRRILVLGAGAKAARIDNMRRITDRYGFTLVGFVPTSGETPQVDHARVLELGIPLAQYCVEHDVDEIVLAMDDRRKGLPVHELLDCKMSGVDVVDILSFFERQTSRIQLDLLHPSWLIFSEGFRSSTLRVYAKRAFDIIASLLVLSITWPLMLLAGAAVWVESGGKGPILFRQVRVGQNWQLFKVLKFRSMRVDAEHDGVARWARKDDDRITRVGRVLRKMRVDELPQLFNVLRGNMSFVGPRPERPEFVEQFAESMPYYAERHRVKPGITGWAQLCYPYGASEGDAFEKLQYDLYYVKNYNLFMDMMILLQTAEVVLWHKGAH